MIDNKKSWHLAHFILIFISALACSILFQKFSTGTWTGNNFYSGAIVLVLLSSIVVCANTVELYQAIIRLVAPCLLVYLFYSASNQVGIINALIARAGLPHFLLVFSAAVASIYFTRVAEDTVSSQGSSENKTENVSDNQERIEADTFNRIVGQSHVISSLREISKITKSGIRLGKKEAPHAVLLFLGPTGVGKTEAARALAEEVYGSKDALIRFDMGQFNDASQANRFYGPPPGYAGFEQGGQLTRAVLKKPNSVVLLDEMEKAHPKIWDAFLPVFDEGYIVDGSSNQKVDMTNTIIVLTSNILAEESSANGEDLSKVNAFEIKNKVASLGVFRPELLGRINEILVFNSLNRDSIVEILKRRLDAALWSLSEQGYKIDVTEQTINSLVDEVQKAKFGVRQIDDVVRTYLRGRVSEVKTQE